ncbi:MOSC domain-containing protein [Actinoplanes couchii]|uniref:MOSC domain-containing protein n=1 Tax=Actinoplanes couchii TaxID=403638 RepID=A0ABQ3XQQ0_9ACTN|nr:transcription elongation factor [Actinoplanes couchii]MDR6323053.1 hypothetical protein [Actinoplanes couchii]GID60727.1 hypothetical protein Aco03nite_091310 [Actinoplanes couchii]
MSDVTGAVVAVSRNDAYTFTKPNRDAIVLVAGLGVEGDIHAGVTVRHRSRVAADPSQPNLRQVHLIQAELFDEVAGKGYEVPAGGLGENVTTRGIDLLSLPRGTILRFGTPTESTPTESASGDSASGDSASGDSVRGEAALVVGARGEVGLGARAEGEAAQNTTRPGTGGRGEARQGVDAPGEATRAGCAPGEAGAGAGAGAAAVSGRGETARTVSAPAEAVDAPGALDAVGVGVALAGVLEAATGAVLDAATGRAAAAVVGAVGRETGSGDGRAAVVVAGLRNPCAQINGFRPGLLKEVLGRDRGGETVRKAGVMGVVLRGGVVRPGDPVAVELPPGVREPLERV